MAVCCNFLLILLAYFQGGCMYWVKTLGFGIVVGMLMAIPGGLGHDSFFIFLRDNHLPALAVLIAFLLLAGFLLAAISHRMHDHLILIMIVGFVTTEDIIWHDVGALSSFAFSVPAYLCLAVGALVFYPLRSRIKPCGLV